MTENNVKMFKPLCPYCRAEWSDDNVQAEDCYTSAGCDTCGYEARVFWRIVIRCHSCGKVMYVKEF